MLVTHDVTCLHIANLVEGQDCVNPQHDRHVFVFCIISDCIVGSAIIGANPQEDIEQGLKVMGQPILSFSTVMKNLPSHKRNSSLERVK
jgi:hypothetical protein